MIPGRQELLARMRAGEVMLGAFANLGSPVAAEACAIAGCQWLLIDLEHGSATEASVLGQVLAAEVHGVPTIVRVESTERIRTGRMLDLGVQGVMFPRIDSVEQAAGVVAHLRYQPEGDRGVATYNRACSFGLDPGALDRANEEIIGIVQIESRSAVEQAAGIAALPGVDVLFVGPRDLSHAMGIPGQTEDPRFRRALADVVQAAEKSGIVAGILAGTVDSAVAFAQEGFRFIGIGSDSSLLASAMKGAIDTAASRLKAGRG